jgi:hypothetical protein
MLLFVYTFFCDGFCGCASLARQVFVALLSPPPLTHTRIAVSLTRSMTVARRVSPCVVSVILVMAVMATACSVYAVCVCVVVEEVVGVAWAKMATLGLPLSLFYALGSGMGGVSTAMQCTTRMLPRGRVCC